MSDHPVLIPTSLGPVGAVVSEPARERRGAAILLQAAGRPARSGVNSFWARIARDLAERGVVALRFDYAAEGESIQVGEGEYAAAKSRLDGSRGRPELDLQALSEIEPWFRQHLGGLDLVLAGSCQGARMAIELAAMATSPPLPSFLIAPYLRKPFAKDTPIDPLVVECLKKSLQKASSRLLVGEAEEPEARALLALLGPAADDLELEIVPDTALHLLDRPGIQDTARSRLLAYGDRHAGRASIHVHASSRGRGSS